MNAGWCPLSSAYHQLQVEAGNKGADNLQITPDSKAEGAHLGPTGPMLAPWTLLSGTFSSIFFWKKFFNFDQDIAEVFYLRVQLITGQHWFG